MTTATLPTEQDYEKLARTVILARGNDPEKMETVLVPGGGGTTQIPAWEFESIDDDNNCVSTTLNTLDDFRTNRTKWSEPGIMQEVNGGLYWEECQAARGQRRCELCVVDCGEFRLFYQV